MSEHRIIDLSDQPAGLSIRHRQLVIRCDEQEITTPVEELAALVVSHPAVCYTQAVLSSLCDSGGIFVLCNERRLPIGMLLPLVGHITQAERFAAQASASLPTKKQLWKQIVRTKVLAQSKLLLELCGNDQGLSVLAKKVRSGDSANIEAQASRRYWPALFGPTFRRNPTADDQNRLLNYGYAVLRAVVARAVAAAGLHPCLGIHHHNRYNPFCLADDLMEPYRPLVDRAVALFIAERNGETTVDKEAKRFLIEQVTMKRFWADNEERTLFDLMHRVASSLAGVFLGQRKKLFLPVL
jgi:CRISPR-associated protein Cas1